MELHIKMSLISIFFWFSVFNHDFIIYITFNVSQVQTQQLTTSQIRSHKEFNANL